jgi:erythromycin esterase
VLHQAGSDDKLLLLATAEPTRELLQPRGHRAIGVVYRPEYERYGNYVPTALPRRYDAFLYLDTTRALHPLYEVQPREEGEVPETYPSGV